ncbi:MAG TPA: CoA transferase [Solirubrobacteraceae bacterium]|nr:CoA transferase [Solirubrobacteraceae bacterium]
MADSDVSVKSDDSQQPLSGIRILEIGGLEVEYTGLSLAGLGADVIKVEPPGGERTRTIGPFANDEQDADKSLHFWAYNRGKQSIVMDPESAEDRETIQVLARSVDIVLTTTAGNGLHSYGIDGEQLRAANDRLIVARMSAFGDDGPWADFVGSDLVHLALGGPVMNCGYDPLPNGRYDQPPIAPQSWHAYTIAGEQLIIGVLAAVSHQEATGRGQLVRCSIHDSVSLNTEVDLMSWVMRRVPFYRQTARHSAEKVSPMTTISNTKDGRWIMTMAIGDKDQAKLEAFLIKHGSLDETAMASLAPEESIQSIGRFVPGSLPMDGRSVVLQEATARLIRKHSYDNVPWREAQEAGLLWAPVRRPEENADDEHWLARGTFAEVEHPEIGQSLKYPARRWRSTEPAWQPGRRAPLLDEDRRAVVESITDRAPARASERDVSSAPGTTTPTAGVLDGVRVLDFSWFLASAGGTRYISALGAECIKVEWRANPDTRLTAMAPVGGREARRVATGPLPGVNDPEMGGNFNHKNAGKIGLSLNVRHPDGLDIARRLVKVSDVVAEGFSAGVLDKWGLGYDVLREIKPDIIYAQQSGMGASGGPYAKYRAVGPIAAALVGHTEMSGLGDGAMPAGWGYSYLDWIGAYSFAQAIMSAIVHRQRTGRGQWIDASQCETGISHLGVPTLDWQVNGRAYQRTGNRSPYVPSAPHGIYPCRGEDRWIAISTYDDPQWEVLVKTIGAHKLGADPKFATLADRIANQDALDAALATYTREFDEYQLMAALQAERVPAGVCQTAQDRVDDDPQLEHQGWLTEVTGAKIGTWPVGEIPFRMSETPAKIGGATRKGAPGYGEDNEYVLGEILGFSAKQIAEFAENDVI